MTSLLPKTKKEFVILVILIFLFFGAIELTNRLSFDQIVEDSIATNLSWAIIPMYPAVPILMSILSWHDCASFGLCPQTQNDLLVSLMLNIFLACSLAFFIVSLFFKKILFTSLARAFALAFMLNLVTVFFFATGDGTYRTLSLIFILVLYYQLNFGILSKKTRNKI